MVRLGSSDVKEMYEVAVKARERSYSPYSGFKVGCGIKVRGSDKIYGGCNVENVSYGGTICAERVAIGKAVSECGRIEIEGVLVVTDAEELTTPCGICLQSILEFSGAETVVYLSDLEGVKEGVLLRELMPRGFVSFEVK